MAKIWVNVSKEASRVDETETRASAEDSEREMALDPGDGLCKWLWVVLSVCHFQKENLVITIKRLYYTADFLEKSVFYWAGLQTHTHPTSHKKHRNRSEQGLAWEETVKGSGLILSAQQRGQRVSDEYTLRSAP